jgi:HEAT repeat protein
MQDEIRFAVLLGRMIELLRSPGDASQEHKEALQALDDLVGRRSVNVRSEGGQISVEGVSVPRDTPFVSRVAQQMDAHGLGAINVAMGASAVELLHAIRAIALSPSNYPVNSDAVQRLREGMVSSVGFVTKQQFKDLAERRSMRLSDALMRAGVFADESGTGTPGVVPAEKGAAYDEMVRHIRASTARTLAGVVEQLASEPAGPSLMGRLEAVQAGVQKALRENDVTQGLEAIVALIKDEEQATSEDAKRAFAITIRRILTGDTIQRLSPYLLDEIYHNDMVKIVRRAGSEGTRIVMEQLTAAPTFAERKAYLSALSEIEEGTDVITSMLKHHEWFVVRNAADLVGELQIKESVPLLGQVAEHVDARVRLAVAIALAKIGTPEAVRYLRSPLRDEDRHVRLTVAQQIKGRGLGGLAMVIVAAAETEEDQEVLTEYFRALGRIGTPDAVRVLTEAVQPRGLLSGRKAADRRRAATEGLSLASDPNARTMLKELASDRDKEVRAIARKALESPSE